MKNILVTGNLGYIGLVLARKLLKAGYNVVGYDTNFYQDCELEPLENLPSKQIYKDIRDITANDFEGIEAIVHLAALSNDPLGELNPALTEEINFSATINMAELARSAGVKRFVYSSSQSMYGVSNIEGELDEDNSEKNPLTSYAKTKWQAECALKELSNDNFIVVCMRPSTVFGVSPRLRCDIVYNNLVACAYTTNRIEIKSDGTPWRPVVHVQDVSAAFIAVLEAPAELVANESFNVGVPNGNFTVRELAEAAQKNVPGSTLVFTGEHGSDSRTYRVCFNKILTKLKDYYQPKWNLIGGGEELVDFFKRVDFNEEKFRDYHCHRLLKLKRLKESGQLDDSLRWKIN